MNGSGVVCSDLGVGVMRCGVGDSSAILDKHGAIPAYYQDVLLCGPAGSVDM